MRVVTRCLRSWWPGGRTGRLPARAPRSRRARAGSHQPLGAFQGAAKNFRGRPPRHTLKGRQTTSEVDRIGLSPAIAQTPIQRSKAGDSVLLYGGESEALTHPYLARAWAKSGADVRVPAPEGGDAGLARSRGASTSSISVLPTQQRLRGPFRTARLSLRPDVRQATQTGCACRGEWADGRAYVDRMPQ